MRLLVLGDVFARPGRAALRARLAEIRRELSIDLCIANGENLAGGTGLTRTTVREIFDAGVDVITGGNHTWDNKEILDFIDEDPRILRPANYPPGTPGRGSGVYQTPAGEKVAVLNLMGRVFMPTVDCPFRAADAAVSALREETPCIVVDMHAEASSEKQAMGYHLDGRVSAVLGTHTHVPTADGTILDGGTAYQTDIGMTGAYDGVIGIRRDLALEKMIHKLPTKNQPATGRVRLCAVLLHVDAATGRTLASRFLQEDL
jgi:hypothetical protein